MYAIFGKWKNFCDRNFAKKINIAASCNYLRSKFKLNAAAKIKKITSKK